MRYIGLYALWRIFSFPRHFMLHAIPPNSRIAANFPFFAPHTPSASNVSNTHLAFLLSRSAT